MIKCGPSSLSATRNLHDLCSADSLNSIRLVKQSVRGVISRLQAPMRRLQYRTSVDCSRSTRGHCSLHPQIGVYYTPRTKNPPEQPSLAHSCHLSRFDISLKLAGPKSPFYYVKTLKVLFRPSFFTTPWPPLHSWEGTKWANWAIRNKSKVSFWV